MFVNGNSEEMKNAVHTFYSPISKYEYLTPLQRKKLREKRKLNSFSEESDETPDVVKSKTLSLSVKKPKRKVLKKILKSEKKVAKKLTNENLPEIRCTAAQLLNRNKSNESDAKKNKFFKTRSPDHFNKANFVVPLTYKRPRLDFTEGKHSVYDTSFNGPINSKKSNKAVLNSRSTKQNENSTLVDSITNHPLVIKVNPVCNEAISLDFISSTVEELPLQNDDCSYANLITEEQENLNGNGKLNFDEQSIQSKSEGFDSKNESVSSTNSDEENLKELSPSNTSPKLYPIFYKKAERQKKSVSLEKQTECLFDGGIKRFARIKDTSGSEQMVIDAGQKEFGAKQCKTCNMIYSIGEGEDEKLHSKYHDMYLSNLKFPGWKKEHVIGNYEDGRIIKISEDDKKFKLKKVQDVLLIANRDLGFSTAGFPVRPNVHFLLFISNDKRVRGCLIAESITSASPVVLDEHSITEDEPKNGRVVWQLGNWYASSETVPAVCGINRIWVAKEYRRRKVASRMIDCLRSNFIFGHVITLEELAFTDPTPDGRDFAAFYTGTDNFLVYK